MSHYPTPMLEIHVSVSMGGIKPQADFLYLQPQVEIHSDIHSIGGNGHGGNSDKGRNSTHNLYGVMGTSKLPKSGNNSFNQGSPRSAGSFRPKQGESGEIFGGPEDREPLPRRLRDVQKERVISIEKGSALCENIGVAYVDYMDLEKGRYRLYYLRIESEQRIMYNSRLELLGASNIFSVHNIISSNN